MRQTVVFLGILLLVSTGCRRFVANAAEPSSASLTANASYPRLPMTTLPRSYAVKRVTELGIEHPYLSGINARGDIVGKTQLASENLDRKAFIWNPEGSTILTAIGDECDADAISDNGIVVGTCSARSDWRCEAVRWHDGLARKIEMLTGYHAAYSAGVNKEGLCVGYCRTRSMRFRAFVTPGTKPVDLGTLGGPSSMAHAINDSGQIVGSSDVKTTGRTLRARAVLWHPKDQPLPESVKATRHTHGYYLINLGTLGGADSSATDINDAGQIVGNAFDTAGVRRAFIWQNGEMTAITPPELGDARAYSINNFGVVLGSWMQGEHHRPFLWYHGQLCELAELLPDSYAWDSIRPMQISDAGIILGRNESEEHITEGERSFSREKGQLVLIPDTWSMSNSFPPLRALDGIGITLQFGNHSEHMVRLAVVTSDGYRKISLSKPIAPGTRLTYDRGLVRPGESYDVVVYLNRSHEPVTIGTLKAKSHQEGERFSFSYGDNS